MNVLGIDPGTAGEGYAVWDSNEGRHVYIGVDPPPREMLVLCDALVVESGFIGRMGLKSMWGLGFAAGCALAYQFARGIFQCGIGINCYTIRPDGAQGWRAALPPRPGQHQKFDGLPGDVIVGRLRVRYGLEPSRTTEHEVEACGIAEAAAAILARPKAKDRRALKAVKR